MLMTLVSLKFEMVKHRMLRVLCDLREKKCRLWINITSNLCEHTEFLDRKLQFLTDRANLCTNFPGAEFEFCRQEKPDGHYAEIAVHRRVAPLQVAVGIVDEHVHHSVVRCELGSQGNHPKMDCKREFPF